MKTLKDFLERLKKQLDVFDDEGVVLTCKELVTFLFSTDEELDKKDAEQILQKLRNSRMFSNMEKIADSLIQTGRASHKIERQYAQALIDQSNFTAALFVLENLAKETKKNSKTEYAEAIGLMGRVYKQLYVNANNPSNKSNKAFIKNAVKHYYSIYKSDPEDKTWHGINVVALLKRAEKDTVKLKGYPTADKLAEAILQVIEDKYSDQEANAWDFATAAEACIALKKTEEGLKWLSGYAKMPYCDAFELGSTLRQLEEVWQLDMQSESGRLMLPILRAELIKRQGGELTLSIEDLKEQDGQKKVTAENYQNMVEKVDASGKLEKVFGDDSFQTLRWYKRGESRCDAVVRIGRDETKGVGTGFLLEGKLLHDSLTDQLVLVTNAHVISDPPEEGALHPSECTVIFEALDSNEVFSGIEIIWSSGSADLDTTIAKFKQEDKERLEKLITNIEHYPVSPYLPAIEEGNSQRIYIIGHPGGGTLQISLYDNLLLDHKDPKIHYRTPTLGGSSGSPVFNSQWKLIALHHAGDREMPKLNGEGTYQANEGIWIESIKKQFGEFLAKG